MIKFALPLVAAVCFAALGSPADASPKKSSTSKSRSSESGAKKKSSSSKKSSKSGKSAKASKSSKTKQRTAKSKAKASEDVALTSSAPDWIDDLPEVELPEADGPPEDELLEPVPDPAQAP